MTKLSLIISHMSFMIDELYLSHHILNDYYSEQFVHNDFKTIIYFYPLRLEY
jgi:hypothetical protein